MNIIKSSLGSTVVIGSNILGKTGELVESQKIGIVTNPTVAELYLKQLLASLDGSDTTVKEIPDTEEAKSMKVAEEICTHFLSFKLGRTSSIIALGGGVVGDVAGFAASIYMRGVDLVQIPTTLLAQIDSSIGGKTGVNHGLGKNLIGAFHQPKLIVSDISVLKTLPEEEIKNGLAEAVKYGIIEPKILDFLEVNLDKIIGRERGALEKLVTMCVELKLRIAESDEKEENERMKLNLGHTIGHAVERASNFTISHGAAVSIGLVAAMELSQMPERKRVETLLKRIGLPTKNGLDASKIQAAMELDKKQKNGLRMVLPKKLGEIQVVEAPSPEKIAEVLK